jgi:hypothetical protein
MQSRKAIKGEIQSTARDICDQGREHGEEPSAYDKPEGAGGVSAASLLMTSCRSDRTSMALRKHLKIMAVMMVYSSTKESRAELNSSYPLKKDYRSRR